METPPTENLKFGIMETPILRITVICINKVSVFYKIMETPKKRTTVIPKNGVSVISNFRFLVWLGLGDLLDLGDPKKFIVLSTQRWTHLVPKAPHLLSVGFLSILDMISEMK